MSSVRPPVPFIVGAPRSGTTLLRMMLDAAALTREALLARITGSDAWPDFHVSAEDLRAALAQVDPFTAADGLRAFHTLYAKRFGKPRWGEKTPDHVFRIRDIAALLPEVRFIHIIRDGRDAAASLRPLWFSPSQDYAALGVFWAQRVREGRRQGADAPHYLEVRYEALIADAETVLRRICAFIEVAYEPGMARYYDGSLARLMEHEGRANASGAVWLTKAQRLAQQAGVTQPPDASRIGAWRLAMSGDEEQRFQMGAESLLEQLGYA